MPKNINIRRVSYGSNANSHLIYPYNAPRLKCLLCFFGWRKTVAVYACVCFCMLLYSYVCVCVRICSCLWVLCQCAGYLKTEHRWFGEKLNDHPWWCIQSKSTPSTVEAILALYSLRLQRQGNFRRSRGKRTRGNGTEEQTQWEKLAERCMGQGEIRVKGDKTIK